MSCESRFNTHNHLTPETQHYFSEGQRTLIMWLLSAVIVQSLAWLICLCKEAAPQQRTSAEPQVWDGAWPRSMCLLVLVPFIGVDSDTPLISVHIFHVVDINIVFWYSIFYTNVEVDGLVTLLQLIMRPGHLGQKEIPLAEWLARLVNGESGVWSSPGSSAPACNQLNSLLSQ